MKNRCKSKKKYGKLNIINVKLCYSAVFSNFAKIWGQTTL